MNWNSLSTSGSCGSWTVLTFITKYLAVALGVLLRFALLADSSPREFTNALPGALIPKCTQPILTNGVFQTTVLTDMDHNYTLARKDSLADTSWALQTCVNGTGSPLTVSCGSCGKKHVFFRTLQVARFGNAELVALRQPSDDSRTYLVKHFDPTTDATFICVPFGDAHFAVYVWATNNAGGNCSLYGLWVGQSVVMRTPDVRMGAGWSQFNTASSWGGRYFRTATAGDYCAGTNIYGSRLFLRGAAFSNCGYGIVEIDGSTTNANCCQKVTQPMIAAGWFAQSELGKCFLDFYGVAGSYDKWFPLADNLVETNHTIVVTATGTARSGASSQRICISGWAGGTGTTSLLQTNADIACYRNLLQAERTFFPKSAILPVLATGPLGGATLFLGDYHNYETQTNLTWTIDGVVTNPTLSAVLYGQTVRIERGSFINHPSVSNLLSKATSLCFDASAPMQMVCSNTFTTLLSNNVNGVYGLMLPTGVDQPPLNTSGSNTVITVSPFNYARCLQVWAMTNPPAVTTDYETNSQSPLSVLFSTDHDFVAMMYPGPGTPWLNNNTNGYYHFPEFRNDGTLKLYYGALRQPAGIQVSNWSITTIGGIKITSVSNAWSALQ